MKQKTATRTRYNWVEEANKAGFKVYEVPQYLYTPGDWKTEKRNVGPICICLFAGAGGASLGMKQAGFHTAVAIDFEKWCMLTYMRNLGKDPNKPTCFIHKDIRQVTGPEILDILEKMGYEPFVDCIWTSPPCQDFSTANMNRNKMACSLDAGSRYCMLESVRIIQELRPRTFIMENVKGLIQGILRPLFDEFLSKLKLAGYHVQWQVVDAADYGVPQHRERVIAVGVEEYDYVFEQDSIPLFATADPPKFLNIGGDGPVKYLGRIEI